MKPEGWIFMIVSWSGILGVFVFCLIRTLGSKDANGKP
jgi:hypothetical protein